MNINRHNYESFFLLYVDHELTAAEQKAVEEFVQQNPDLEKELSLLQQSVFLPDNHASFAGKEQLFKGEPTRQGIHAGNYETFFVLYADNELSVEEKRAVEAFVYHHPQYQGELELLQAVRLAPDTSVVFEDKQSLYRKEKDDKAVPFPWWRIAAAAMVLLLLGIWWMTREKPADPGAVALKPGQQTAPVAKTDTPAGQVLRPGEIVKPAPVSPDMASDGKDAPNKQPDNNTLPAHPKKDDAPQELAQTPVVSQPTQQPNTVPEKKLIAAIGTEPDVNEGRDNVPALPEHPRNTIGRINIIAEKPGLKNQEENNAAETNPNAMYASNNSNNDRIDETNTSVTKKNTLRGLFRKASRIIAKKNGIVNTDDDDDDRKHILIGGFAIAVK
ncbi:MAG TPA: hypothetical protein VLD19_00575 [Chitinophagaceae bacterium]|nr:hypothetical protein [Chitinophagaceae bacterium]